MTSHFTDEQLREWHYRLAEADRLNIFCHCQTCGFEWVASSVSACQCGSSQVEAISCWQFPDD